MSETHYETKNLALFLQRFDDQALASFQAATEDRTIGFMNPFRCVIGFFNHNLNPITKQGKSNLYLDMRHDVNAKSAEMEYALLFEDAAYDTLLRLIAVEWERRSRPKSTYFVEVVVDGEVKLIQLED